MTTAPDYFPLTPENRQAIGQDVIRLMADPSDLDTYLDEVERPPDYYGPRDEYMAGATEPFRPPWRPENDAAADWALRKLAKAQSVLADHKQRAAERIANITLWLSAVSRPLEATINHFEGQLKDYALRRREQTGEKSVKLPSGTLGTTLHNKGGAVEITAKTELLAWLATYHDLEDRWCKIELEPQVSKIKAEVFIDNNGSVCMYCDLFIVLGEAPWVSSNGAACLAGPTDDPRHVPVVELDTGEVIFVPVVVTTLPLLGRVPVPGLGVKAESITAKVEPSL